MKGHAMLTMRKTQMNAFADYVRAHFEERMAAHLRGRFREQTRDLDDAALAAQVHHGTETAKGYGVKGEDDVRRFLEYQVLLGADFDTAPKTAWAGKTLRDEALTGSEKMNRIDDYATFAIREP